MRGMSLLRSFLLFLALFSSVFGSEWSFAQISDVHYGYTHADPLGQLKEVVAHLNSQVEEKNVQFVFVTGDLSHDAFTSEFEEVKQVLDNLLVPYLPIPGNHDIWWSNKTSLVTNKDEPHPTGDTRMAQIYEALFSNPFPVGSLSHYSGFSPVANLEHDSIPSTFMNFQLVYNNVLFLAFDWNSREKNKLGPGFRGAMPGIELHDFSGGTFPWFVDRWSDVIDREELEIGGGEGEGSYSQIVFVMHQPFFHPDVVPSLWTFEKEEKESIEAVLMKASLSTRKKIWGGVAGHLHMWEDRYPLDGELEGYREWESSDVKSGVRWSVVMMSNGTVTQCEKYDLGK